MEFFQIYLPLGKKSFVRLLYSFAKTISAIRLKFSVISINIIFIIIIVFIQKI